jgi:hypothetical protein
MLFVSILFLVLLLLAILFLVLGLISPQLAFFKKRRHVLYFYPGAVILFFLCMSIFLFSWSITSEIDSTLPTQGNIKIESELQSKTDALSEENIELQEELITTAQSVSELTEENEQLKQNTAEQNKELSTVKEQLAQIEKEKIDTLNDLNEEKEKNEGLTSQLTDAESVQKKLQEEIDGMKSNVASTEDTSDTINTYKEEDYSSSNSVYFENCSAAKAAGAAPVRTGDPGYSRDLDRDGDGIGCES